MEHVEHILQCNAPTDYAFDYATDYQLMPNWVMGIKRYSPITKQTSGIGAKFDGEINFGPISAHIQLSYTEWEAGKLFSALIAKGVKGAVTLKFDPINENQTKITIIVDYSANKSGILGSILEKAMKTFIGPCLRYMEKNLSNQINTNYAAKKVV